jgi:hypothetical protein
LPGTGDFVLRVAADRATAETPLHVAYPAIYAFSRADPDRLAALAAMTGGRVLAVTEPIFAGGERRWVAAREGWKFWVLAALALFLADLVIRYASGLRGRGRKTPEPA